MVVLAVGCGGEAAPPRELRVPDSDGSPPGAEIRLDRETAARLDVTAVATDTNGGVARVRVSWRDRVSCPGRPPRPRVRYLPPPAIERIKITPGTLVPIERRRSTRIDVPKGCGTSGEVWAEAVNAHGLESVSPPVRFALPGP